MAIGTGGKYEKRTRFRKEFFGSLNNENAKASSIFMRTCKQKRDVPWRERWVAWKKDTERK